MAFPAAVQARIGLQESARAVNWCPNDKTVLANEQVIAGECERCGAKVEQRFLEQWFFRITDYAGRLLDNLDRLDWSESTKQAQRNWIGRSDGAEISFRVQDLEELIGAATIASGLTGEFTAQPADIRVFTTRPDTIFGATYLVLAPEHPLVDAFTTDEQRDDVAAYTGRSAKQDLVSRKVSKEKTGVFTGSFAINPATQRADSDLDRRLRAHGVRHGRDHGRAWARRARFRVCEYVRPADRPRHRAERLGRRTSHRRTPRIPRRRTSIS